MAQKSNAHAGDRLPRWSTCSQNELAEQLRKNHTWCLLNPPLVNVSSALTTTKLPFASYGSRGRADSSAAAAGNASYSEELDLHWNETANSSLEGKFAWKYCGFVLTLTVFVC